MAGRPRLDKTLAAWRIYPETRARFNALAAKANLQHKGGKCPTGEVLDLIGIALEEGLLNEDEFLDAIAASVESYSNFVKYRKVAQLKRKQYRRSVAEICRLHKIPVG